MKYKKNAVFTDQEIDQAKANGIPYKTLLNRYAHGWSRHDAVNTPLYEHRSTYKRKQGSA